MQSGISASQSLHDAFAAFTSDTSLFCLPVTIESESLVPLEAVRFSGDFASSLPSLGPHLQEKTPIYLLVRPSPTPSPSALLTAITYVPSTSPVRAKTLFASTRQSLTRTLGLEKFGDSLFVTDAFEVTDPAEWAARARSKQQQQQQQRYDGDGEGEGDNDALLSAQERELQRVKRAEEEERHGTSGKQLSGGQLPGNGSGSSSSGLAVRATDEARVALRDLADSELVQLGLDLASETLVLLLKATLSPDQVQAKVPTDRPTYNFYRYAEIGTGTESGVVLFIYVCPGVSKVKERMMYASSRNGVIETAKAEGVAVAKRLELDADDITADRLAEEAGVGGRNSSSNNNNNNNNGGSGGSVGARGGVGTGGGGFARPKRPGRR